MPYKVGMTILGSRIIEARKRRGFTQRELAEALGVTIQAVSQWENDKTDASSRLLRIAAALHCDPAFLTGEGADLTFDRKQEKEIDEKDIPIIPLRDLQYYLAFFGTGHKIQANGYINTGVKPVGQLFAIVPDKDGDGFNAGDLLIFDNGIEAQDGDLAALIILNTSFMQLVAAGKIDNDSQKITASIAKIRGGNPENATTLRALNLSEGKKAPDAVLIVATMVERRIYRPTPPHA